MLILVSLIVVDFFSFLNITPLRKVGRGRNLFQMNLTGLPELFEHDISCKNNQEDEEVKLFFFNKA